MNTQVVWDQEGSHNKIWYFHIIYIELLRIPTWAVTQLVSWLEKKFFEKKTKNFFWQKFSHLNIWMTVLPKKEIMSRDFLKIDVDESPFFVSQPISVMTEKKFFEKKIKKFFCQKFSYSTNWMTDDHVTWSCGLGVTPHNPPSIRVI